MSDKKKRKTQAKMQAFMPQGGNRVDVVEEVATEG
jgi:hypothetical protein